MPLNPGDVGATQGMARDIYLAMDATLRPPLEADLGDAAGDALPPIQDAWRTLSFAVATGVIAHLERQPPSEPEFAETFTSTAQDAAYWAWLSGFAGVFGNWASAGGTLPQLHSALGSFLGSNPVPAQLRGVLR